MLELNDPAIVLKPAVNNNGTTFLKPIFGRVGGTYKKETILFYPKSIGFVPTSEVRPFVIDSLPKSAYKLWERMTQAIEQTPKINFAPTPLSNSRRSRFNDRLHLLLEDELSISLSRIKFIEITESVIKANLINQINKQLHSTEV